MTKKKIKPGRMFWVGTFVVGVFSPGKGKRRVHSWMKRMDADWKAVQKQNLALREELATAYEEIERLRSGEGKIVRPRPSWAVTSGEPHVRPAAPADDGREETVPLPRVDPGVVRVRHLSEVTGATSLPEAAATRNES